jgi:hypothetical protein
MVTSFTSTPAKDISPLRTALDFDFGRVGRTLLSDAFDVGLGVDLAVDVDPAVDVGLARVGQTLLKAGTTRPLKFLSIPRARSFSIKSLIRHNIYLSKPCRFSLCKMI